MLTTELMLEETDMVASMPDQRPNTPTTIKFNQLQLRINNQKLLRFLTDSKTIQGAGVATKK